jgi:ribosomal protein S18 acetylase RimI-like enzyme
MPFYPVEANLRAAMRAYAGCTPLGEARDHPGIALVSSGVNFSVFNSAMLTYPVASPADLHQRLEIARVYFEQRRLDWSFWVCHDLLDSQSRRSLSESMRKRGHRQVAEPPGLYAPGLAPSRRPPALLEFRQVLEQQQRDDFIAVSRAVFSLPPVIAREIYGPAGTWSREMTGYIAYRDKQPVSIVACVVAAGVIGIYSLGTLPIYQRRGYGETLLRHALNSSYLRNGSSRTILQSTEAGLRLYQNLGYKPVTRFSVFVHESRPY